MKKLMIMAVILFTAFFCQAQADTTKKEAPKVAAPVAKTEDKLTSILNQAYQKFGQDTGKYLTKEQWDMTMNILSTYLVAAMEAYNKKEGKPNK